MFPGRKQSVSSSDEEVSVPVRKVKPPPRKPRKEKLPNPVEPAMDSTSSPEESSGRKRSSKRGPAMGRTLYVDTVTQKPQKASTQRSKKQTHDTSRPSERQHRWTSTASPESPAGNDERPTQQEQLSDEETVNKKKKKKKGQGVHSKRSQKTPHRSHPSLVSPSSQSSDNSEGSEKKQRTRIRVPKTTNTAQTVTKGKQSKCSKVSPPSKPLSKMSRSRKTQKAKKGSTEEPDEDEWTEAELLKLHE